jgi:hypothetical protein
VDTAPLPAHLLIATNRTELIGRAYNSTLQFASADDTALAYFQFEQSAPCWMREPDNTDAALMRESFD